MSVQGNIRVMYLNILGRPADPGGLNAYTNQYNNQKARGASDDQAYGFIADQLLFSGEGKDKAGTIRNAYQTFLGRAASNSEVQNYLNKGWDSRQISKDIRNSVEATQFRQKLDNYINAYPDLQGLPRNASFQFDTRRFGRFPSGNYLAAVTHWRENGRNENRMVPGQQIVITDANGNLRYSDGAQKLLSNNVKNRYDNLIRNFNSSSGGNYKQLMQQAAGLGGQVVVNDFFNGTYGASKQAFDFNYKKQKIRQPWDASKGVQPPVGGFDATYYATQDKEAVNRWNAAKNNKVAGYSVPDLDVTFRYGDNLDTFLSWSYTSYGKNNGIRGNKAVEAKEATQYKENFDSLTDAEKAVFRDQMLGLTDKTESGNLTIDWEKDDSILEGRVENTFSEKDKEQQQRFTALTLDALKQAGDKLKEQARRESDLALYRGLPGFSEIYDVNETLTNSILGDSGIGGLLGLVGDSREIKENFEEDISKFTGISNNSTLYNWQKWFDDTLVKRYEDMTEIADPDDAKKIYELESEFRDKFIEDYLKPRFDESKSMSEFLSYMDVVDSESEQNIFQTQTALNSLRDLASLRAQQYYTGLKNSSDAFFNTEFYFDPLTAGTKENPEKADTYALQAESVKNAWDAAKKTPNAKVQGTDYTWNQWAYYYGLDLNDKAAFAKLHYQVLGRGQGFDPAEDVVTTADVNNFIKTDVIPALEDKKLDIGDTAFLGFVTPAEFADSVLESIDPLENKEEWKKVLEMYGLDEDAAIEEVREYIIEAVRTGEAKDIRESIKYLNEKKIKPTQKRLGVTYIERESDVKNLEDKESTAFYEIFRDAGYGGTQEEFFDEFMPDVDRGDLGFLTKAMKGDLKLKDVGSDPFEALSDLSGFLGDGDEDIFGGKTRDSDDSSRESSYFDLFADEKEDNNDYATKTGRSIIDDYTSFFK